jgi:Flp pilus assembly pilin Flp
MAATRSNPILTCLICGHPVLIGSVKLDWTGRPIHEQCTVKVTQPDQATAAAPVKKEVFRRLWRPDAGQDIAEYAVMLAVILVLVVGTVRLIGSNANNVFSSAASTLQ